MRPLQALAEMRAHRVVLGDLIGRGKSAAALELHRLIYELAERCTDAVHVRMTRRRRFGPPQWRPLRIAFGQFSWIRGELPRVLGWRP